MVLGYPSTGQLPPGRYTGQVTANGDVAVYDKQTGKQVGSKTSQELDYLEVNERLNKTGMQVGAKYPSVSASVYVPPVASASTVQMQQPMQQYAIAQNAQNVAYAVTTIASVVGMIATAVAKLSLLKPVNKDITQEARNAATKAKEASSKINQSLTILRNLKEKLQP